MSIRFRVSFARRVGVGSFFMANPFHVMRVRNRLPSDVPYNVSLLVLAEDHDEYTGPERDDLGRFVLPLIHPTGDERHLALGRFMDEWSKLEIALSGLLSNVLGMGFRDAPALRNALGNRGTTDVISAHAQAHFKGPAYDGLIGLLERVKENNTRRNSLAHGFWMLEWNIVDHGGKPAALPRQYRCYTPSDPELAKRLEDPRNRKDRHRFMFTPKRIEAIAKAVARLTRDLQEATTAQFPHANKPVGKDHQLAVVGTFVRSAAAKPAPNYAFGFTLQPKS